MTPHDSGHRITAMRGLEWFVFANVAFLGLDILVAHRVNAFRRPAEWVPVAFSALATLALLPTALGRRPARWTIVERAVGFGAVAVGVTGMVLHLESAFFVEWTLEGLVYSAPFVAPLAYVGVGLLLLLLRLEPATSPSFGWWTLLLALGGFIGNFAMSLLDHAQNGLFHWTEWIPIVSAAYAVGFLAVALVKPLAPMFVVVTYVVLALQAGTGILGFALHAMADVTRRSLPLTDRFVFGAPPFAPLLFTNLAVLAALGL